MKVLAIGNSFSQDATRYLHQLAKADGTDLKVVNLYIGGCPLRLHYFNMLENAKAYSLEFNGVTTGFKVSVKEALMSDVWDVVTLQQVSHQSPDYKTYQPYLDALAAYVRKYAPHAKLYIHQTWAYEDGSERLAKTGYKTAKEMFAKVEKSYKKAAKAIDADGTIHSGKAMLTILEKGIAKIHRDTFHASLGLGRYLLGLVWYKALTGKSVLKNTFDEFDEPVSPKEIAIAKQVAEKIK